ncbi:MAG: tRNA lysidine(34) synthetase TilS [Bacteroides sp.]|nr:MAG: tRNA lysidine(34) synthetase TilS [Bacteroides sp.]
MIKKILKNLKKYHLYNKYYKFLLAVSGGIDSMTMLHCFSSMKIKFSIIHCNFQLRKEESDRDMNFIKNYSIKNNITCYINNFNTKEYSKKNKISIQMSARYLRYSWFKTIALKYNYNYIAIAHHNNDLLETFLINIIRGTGIDGLTGIKYMNKNIIRPMIYCTKNEIIEYAIKHKIQYMNDSSNFSNAYSRNNIRNNVIPILKKINPSLENTISSICTRMEYTKETIKKMNNDSILENIDTNTFFINKKHLDTAKIIVFNILQKKYNFSFNTIIDIIENNYQSGKKFLSSTHNIIIDRKGILISKNINSYKSYTDFNQLFSIKINKIDESIYDNKNKNIAYFDYDKLIFPIYYRFWIKGDFFKPLGSTFKVKLSDFFINNKISCVDKQKIPLLISNNEIIWIVNYRINDDYKISQYSKKICMVKYHNTNLSNSINTI